MLKVNLEKELIRQNRSIVTSRDLLLIKEYDTMGEVVNDTALTRVFGDMAAKAGRNIKERVENLKTGAGNFNQERVFHISQIERLCKKYHLRFLSSNLYKGSIDKETASKISQFEIAYGVECRGGELNPDMFDRLSRYVPGNTFIAAPASAFKLEERPKDPLLFYKINDEYYYLIHKWGNDLSLVRRLYPLLSMQFISFLVVWIPLALLSLIIAPLLKGNEALQGIGVFLLIAIGVVSLFCLIEDEFRFAEKNDWRSKYAED